MNERVRNSCTVVLRNDQRRDLRLFGTFRSDLPSVSPNLLHFSTFEVQELPQVLVVRKWQCFVPFFKMNLYEIFPDSGDFLWADGTMDWYVGARG